MLNTHCTDERAARDWVIDKLAELRRGDASALTAERVTLDALERLVREDYTLRGRISNRASRHVPLAFGHLRAYLGNARARDITEARLRAYAAARLQAGAARATVNLEFDMLGRGFALAARSGILPARPRGWLPRLALHNVRRGFFERAAFEAIRAALPEYLRPLVTVAYVTGWRVASDLLTRQWHHVDFAAGFLRLDPGEGKTREARAFPFTPQLAEALQTQRAYTDEVERRLGAIVPWVFHREGRRVRDLSGAWHSACRAAGMPHALRHDFRRTAARNIIRSGTSESQAMAMMGLRTPAIFRRYFIVDEGLLREAGERLARLEERLKAEAGKVAVMPKRR